MMRYLVGLALLAACLDSDVPWRKVGSRRISGDWVAMGLPVAGGDVRRTDPDRLIVTFPKATTTEARRRAAAFEATLQAAGWSEVDAHGELTGGTVRRVAYRTQKGHSATLDVERRSGELRVTVSRSSL